MSNTEEEYITLKDLFLKIGTYVKEVRKNIVWLILVGCILAILFGVKAYFSPTMYHEKLTFMMDEKIGSDIGGGLSTLKGLFGGDQQNNIVKILQLFESKKIVNNTLFDTIRINNKNDYLANHFFDEYTIEGLVDEYKRFGMYRVGWVETLMKDTDFRFTHSAVDSFGVKENLYLRILYEKVNGNESLGIPKLLDSKLDEESGIMTLLMKSEREEITLGILNNIYKQLSAFFIEKSIEKQLKTFNIIKYKKDSVYTALKSSEYQLANFRDRNHNLVTLKGNLQEQKLERDVRLLNSLYAQHVMQMESTDFALRNKTPLVQVIDLPRRPISPSRNSLLKGLIFGFIVGVALVSAVVVVRKLGRDIMEAG